MTSLNGIWQTQVATVNPSPPAVVSTPPAPAGNAAAAELLKLTKQPTAEAAPPPEEALKAPPVEQVTEAAKQIESFLRNSGRSLEFRVDGTTGRTVVSVRNAETGELIRQIPGEEVLRLASILGSHNGGLVDLTV